jgi:hypothetical protein
VAADNPGDVGEDWARHRQRGKVEQHRSPSADGVDLEQSRHLPGASLSRQGDAPVSTCMGGAEADGADWAAYYSAEAGRPPRLLPKAVLGRW